MHSSRKENAAKKMQRTFCWTGLTNGGCQSVDKTSTIYIRYIVTTPKVEICGLLIKRNSIHTKRNYHELPWMQYQRLDANDGHHCSRPR